MAAGSNTMSKILLIGGTGYIGKFMVEASAKAGHPTFLLIRESTLSNPAKSSIINNFNDLSVNLLVVRQIPFLQYWSNYQEDIILSQLYAGGSI